MTESRTGERGNGRVVVAMSGGVDSSVAAALLSEQGYEVVGVMMRLWAEQENRCCAPQAVDDARQVAGRLGIPFYLVNYEAEFRTRVVDYFINEYAQARTPNPCLACNRHIRFGRLLRHAEALDAQYLATGHYARVTTGNGQHELRMGADAGKDQSYVLYMLGQAELRRVLFPVGRFAKTEVRQMARQRNLPVADRVDSMELCFVADDYRRFLRRHAPETTRPGVILDRAGREIGRHSGLADYTIGQRSGLGNLDWGHGPAGSTPEAMYVVRLDRTSNAVVVGTADELGRQTLQAQQVSCVRGVEPSATLRVQAKIRYRAPLVGATWTPMGQDSAEVQFDVPLRDITPGQAVVAYLGDRVLGGGIIQ